MSANPFFRIPFWIIWFFVVPAFLAGMTVWLVSPGEAATVSGPLGFLQSIVQNQPVPVAIVLFTIFVTILWSQRHILPLADRAGVAGRRDVPASSRKRYEHAGALLEEAARTMRRHHRDIERAVPAAEREDLQARLQALRASMEAKEFDQARFDQALTRAEQSVEKSLAPWRKGELREYAESIAIAIAVAFLLRAFVVEAFKIPSRSMVPTLAVGDHIFVNKFAYGPIIPFTNTRLFSRLPPERGSVIVFQFPEHPEQDFIKRVIGTPGDRIEAVDGRPIINGWLVPRCKVGPFSYDEGEGPYAHHEGELYVEYLGDEAYLTFFDHTLMAREQRTCESDADCAGGRGCVEGVCGEYQGPWVVPPNQTFMMGDNRMNSHDSRGWFGGRGGGVPFDYIRGSALWVWMSFRTNGTVAWDRIGINVMGTPRLPAPYQQQLADRIAHCLNNRPAQTHPPEPSR